MVSSIWLLLLFIVPATIFVLLVAPTIAQGDVPCTHETEYCWKCSEAAGSYNDGSLYQQNLNSLLSSFPSSITTQNSGFYNSSLGDDPDKVNAIALCRGDLGLDKCRSCVNETTQILLRNCSNHKEAIIWSLPCMVRYSQNLIFGVKEEDPYKYLLSGDSPSNAQAFELVLKPLLQNLRNTAANLGDSREKFAAGHATVLEDETIYALLQCTPDIDKENCSICLKNSISFIQDVQAKVVTGARVNKPSCSLRYEAGRFYEPTADSPVNVTALVTPETPAPLPPKQADPQGNVSAPVTPTPSPSRKVKSKSGIVIGSIVGGCIILVVGMALFLVILWKKRVSRDKKAKLLDDKFEKGTGPRKFSYKTLVEATSNFAKQKKLGEGGFGAVYKGFIKELNSFVAVKRVQSGSKQGLKEYEAEVTIISRLGHRNLVQLIGWCHEKEELILVYEFMPEGSLDSHLFNGKSLLTWEVRYKIAQDLASGLLYLHQEWEQCVLHRDIKSSNVMLDSKYNAKLGDFGLARLVDHGKPWKTTVVAGTQGYMAIEHITSRKASKKTDIYSFGVVALEIACGRKPVVEELESSQVLMVNWVWELYGREQVIEAADPKLRGSFDEEQMKCLMIVGLWCAHPNHVFRPSSIMEAIQVLNSKAPLPNLPLEMPDVTSPPHPMPRSATSSERTKTESSNGHRTNSSLYTTCSRNTNIRID